MRNTRLSERELEVLKLYASGHGYNEIAKELDITWNTVSSYTRGIRRKLGVWTTVSAVVVAIRDGDIDPDKLEILRRYR